MGIFSRKNKSGGAIEGTTLKHRNPNMLDGDELDVYSCSVPDLLSSVWHPSPPVPLGWENHTMAVASFGECKKGDTVVVDFTGNTPTVRLVEEGWIKAYENGQSFDWWGNDSTESPCELKIPHDGIWNAVADFFDQNTTDKKADVGFLIRRQALDEPQPIKNP